MRVKILRSTWTSEFGRLPKNVEIDVSDSTGLRWVEHRIAVEIKVYESPVVKKPDPVEEPVLEIPEEDTTEEEDITEEEIDFENTTRAELAVIAQDKGLKVSKNMAKYELVELLSKG